MLDKAKITSILKYIINAIWLMSLSLTALHGQGKYIPDGIRVGANVKTLITTFVDDKIDHHEIAGDINFHKYLLAVELGKASLRRSGQGFDFNTEGVYCRAGADVNFLHNMEGNSVLGLGLRYALGECENSLRWRIPGEVWGTKILSARNANVSSRWWEALLVFKADALQNLQLGFNAGLRFSPVIKGGEGMEVYEIPGYGYTEATSLWSFNYYIFYYIPFKKK